MSANEKGSEHYLKMAIEPWDVIDTWPVDQRIGFYRGNLLKYTLRLGCKDAAISEAKKAQHYAEKLVETLEQAHITEIVMNMEKNDLSMSICDSLNLADSFLDGMKKDLKSWQDSRPVTATYQADDLRYGEKSKQENWSEADEERMRNIMVNGNDGEVYQDNDGWIEYTGGGCPVGLGVRVLVRRRDGTELKALIAGLRCWDYDGRDDFDIVAYKVIDAEVTP